jgi:hypothetical protein
MRWLRVAAVASLAVVGCLGQDKGKPASPPKEAQDALRETVNKIAKSYKLLNESKKDWEYKIASAERGKIDPAVWGNDRREVFCVVIDPMIPTFTDWKIGNFVIYREQGALWVAEESDKDNFLRLSCKNFKNPGDTK